MESSGAQRFPHWPYNEWLAHCFSVGLSLVCRSSCVWDPSCTPCWKTLMRNSAAPLTGRTLTRTPCTKMTFRPRSKWLFYPPHKLKNRKLFLYSAHDTTLIPCLMALGVFDMAWPPYAADITLELHQHRQTKEASVKVSYMGQVRATAKYPGCSHLFPLDLCVSVCRIDLYQAVAESTAPWRSSSRRCQRTPWAQNSTSHYVKTQRAWRSLKTSKLLQTFDHFRMSRPSCLPFPPSSNPPSPMTRFHSIQTPFLNCIPHYIAHNCQNLAGTFIFCHLMTKIVLHRFICLSKFCVKCLVCSTSVQGRIIKDSFVFLILVCCAFLSSVTTEGWNYALEKVFQGLAIYWDIHLASVPQTTSYHAFVCQCV